MPLGLFYDCETTGKVLFDRAASDPSQPRMTQLCCILADLETRQIRGTFAALIIPDVKDWTMDPEAEKITGLTAEICRACGIGIRPALGMLAWFVRQAAVIVAHNKSFDDRVIEIENAKLNAESVIGARPGFCTMKYSTDACKIPNKGRGGYKWPKVSEALKILCGEDLTGAHDALADTLACMKVYFALNPKLAAPADDKKHALFDDPAAPPEEKKHALTSDAPKPPADAPSPAISSAKPSREPGPSLGSLFGGL